ncbi:MAG: ribonuclease HI family protein [Deltaproteobacteria bacterium]|nr:ribonuclease HI family protein [Deltaproteobacteria bacterium]MDZ4224883.1 ribonuclease HI family protein [bacterium]
MKALILYTDGAARGNPGPAGAGWVILAASGATLAENKKYLGELTNNQAEYQALLLALKEAMQLKGESLALHCDSELVVRQIKGEYKVKNDGLKPLFREAVLTLSKFKSYSINHVPREQNEEADRLANEAIDEYFG